MAAQQIGTAKGPGDRPQEYTFLTPDRDNAVKVGEFVYYPTRVDGAEREVIGRVVRRRPARLYPDEFSADPLVSPASVAGALGYSSPEAELFDVTVSLLGYFDERLKSFVNPRIPPRQGWPIYLVPDDVLSRVLNPRTLGAPGSAHVGYLLSRPGRRVPVVLSTKELVSTHMAIIASTGAGKSYLAGVVIEELMKPGNRACLLIVDPHGEYHTLDAMQGISDFAGPDGYKPEVKIITPEQVYVKAASLTLGDLRYLLSDMGERMDYILSTAHRRVIQDSQKLHGSPEHWTIDDLKNAVRAFSEEKEAEGADFSSSVHGVLWRLDRLAESSIFKDYDHISLGELFKPGQCTVLQLNEIDPREQQVIVSVLLRRLYRARMETVRQKAKPGEEAYLPYPAFVLLEEAHHFAPGGEGIDRVVSARQLKTILSEGRKFGIGVGLISQRPGKLDQDVLSQCMTQFILRIVNPIDQNTVASAVESASKDILDELPALSRGQAVVGGPALNAPALIQVRQRLTPHGGESIDSPKEWVAYFAPEAQEQRKRDEAYYIPNRGNVSKFPTVPGWIKPRSYEQIFGENPPEGNDDR
ncbi:MAG: ATP-binding protein [Chloroflexota bacterium]|jgi:DNA helicase HerA-like ATPase